MRVFSTFVSTIPNLEDLAIKKLERLGKIGAKIGMCSYPVQ